MDLDFKEKVGGVAGSSESCLALFDLDLQAVYSNVVCFLIPFQMTVKSSSIELPGAGVSDVAFRKDSAIFASAGWDHRVRVFSRTGKPLAILKFHSATVSCVDFSPNTKLLASGSQDKRIALWSLY